MEFDQVLSKTADPNMPEAHNIVLNPNDAGEKLQIEERKWNNNVIFYLTISFQTYNLIQLVLSTYTTNWPKGQINLSVKNLLEAYQPNDAMTEIEMRGAIRQISMDAHTDPKTPFRQLCLIENKYQATLSKAKKSSTILTALPNEYKGLFIAEMWQKGIAY